MGIGTKFEHRGRRENRRTNRFQPEYEQMDARVLLSTFGGSDHLGGATISRINRQAVGSHVVRHDANLVTSALSGTSRASHQSDTLKVGSGGAPFAPSFTATADSPTQIDLAWKSVAGAGGYYIAEWVNGSWTGIGGVGGGSTGCAVTGLSPNTTYYFDVAAFNVAGATWGAVAHGATTPGALAPPAAASFTATAASGTEIDLAWNQVAGASGYYIAEWINGSWTGIGGEGSGSTGCAVTGLRPNTTYYFDVAAFNAAGATWGAVAHGATTAAALAPPAAASFTATAASGTEIDLAWNQVAGASGYYIAEWVNGSWTGIGSVGGGSTGFAVTGLSPNTTYYFDVAAFNAAGATWGSSQSIATSQNNVEVSEPTADGAYSPVNGSLFGSNGPSYLDVEQGVLGDCWLLASLAEVAARAPSDIENMFTYDGTTVVNGATVGLYTVRYFNNAGTPQYVTVDTELPAGGTIYDHPANGVLWVALAEKAYAEANGAGFVTTDDVGSDSYDAMNEGQADWALQAITGKPASYFSINPSNIAAAWNAGEFIVLATVTPASSYIVPGHAYALVGYNSSNSQPFEVYNPWGITSSGMALGNSAYYGQFYANADFLSQNFVGQYIGTGAASGIDDGGNGPQEGAELLLALDPKSLRHSH